MGTIPSAARRLPFRPAAVFFVALGTCFLLTFGLLYNREQVRTLAMERLVSETGY